MDKNSIKQHFLGISPKISLFWSDHAKIMEAEIIVEHEFSILIFIYFGCIEIIKKYWTITEK